MAVLSGRRLVRFLIIFAYFTSCFQSISTKDYVPVFIWGSTSAAASGSNIPALTRISYGKFGKILAKTLRYKTAVIVFVEEELSVEDFSRKDSTGRGYFPKLQELSASSHGTSFLSSVRSPMNVITSWSKNWKHCTLHPEGLKPEIVWMNNIMLIIHFRGPSSGEDRGLMMKRHDSAMSEIYEELLEKSDDVIALYTGDHPSWVDDDVDVEGMDTAMGSTWLDRKTMDHAHFYNGNDSIYLYTGFMPHLVIKGKNVTLPAPNNVTMEPGDKKKESNLIAEYPTSPPITIQFDFRSRLGDYWTLKEVQVTRGGINYTLAAQGVGAPFGCCFRRGKKVVFKSTKKNDKDTSLTFYNIQVQPELEKGNGSAPPVFGKPSPEKYVTGPIATVYLLVALFIGVVSFGAYMVMSIKACDRFDDPKGNTIKVNVNDF